MLKMKDEHGHTITVNDELRASFEARGFQLVGDAPPLAEGALVGTAVRVFQNEEAPVGPDHVPAMIQATDGEQVIWVDANHTPRLASFLARGFLPIPPYEEPARPEGMSDEAFLVLVNQARRDYAAQVDSIKQEARAKKGAS